jgi:hypothetical protein
MHIDRIEIEGYQHLRGAWDLGPQLTVVTGPNEAGKSTLQEALRIGLFGFSPDERRRRGGQSHRDLRRPWDGGPFRLVLQLVDREDRRVRLTWDLDQEVVVGHDADTGAELLRESPLQRVPFGTGPRLLGITRAEHDQLGCLVQGEIAPVRASESLTQALRQAVEATAGSDGGAQAADERLRALLTRLGVHSGHYGETQSGTSARTRDEIVALEAGHEAARSGREDSTASRRKAASACTSAEPGGTHRRAERRALVSARTSSVTPSGGRGDAGRAVDGRHRRGRPCRGAARPGGVRP